jgi:hypothetical protein
MYLLLRNEQLRNIIDTLTTKVVLILGRFSDERIKVLRRLKQGLREAGLVPVLFDFKGPESLTIVETVTTLARMSKCIVADITDPRAVYLELGQIIPNVPSVPVLPILHHSQTFPETMRYLEKFKSFKRTLYYDDVDEANLGELSIKVLKFIKFIK